MPDHNPQTIETCDYCHKAEAVAMRITGWTELDGNRRPLAKLWCRNCPTDDECDADATMAFMAAVKARR